MTKQATISSGMMFTMVFVSSVISAGIVFGAMSLAPSLQSNNTEINQTPPNLDIEIEKGIERYIQKQQEKQAEEQKKYQEEIDQARMNLPKKDNPIVELFVMSHCPYGTQIEKGMLPVLETLGNKIDFKLKFCNYSMHDKKELDEQMTQYCIQKDTPNKLTKYLKCFLKAGDSNTCLSEVGIDSSLLNSCIKEAESKYKVIENYNNKVGFVGQFPSFNIFKEDNEKYGVQGSPTLIVNGKEIQSGRDPKSLLESVCLGFNNQPEECKTELANTPFSPGFGFDESGTNSNASCN